MDQNYAFTYVIGYRHRIDRINNLRRVLDWINGFNGVEVILVEQDTHSKISHLNLRAKHIFVKSNLPYNRSWAFNVALKNCNSSIIVFGDSDIIMNPNDFINGLNSLKYYDMVSPYNSVIDLTQNESILSMDNLLLIDRAGRGENDNQKINISGGISMFNTESILKIGGWNEDFWSWGCEDDAQTIKVHNFLKWIELKSKCYHFYHDKEQPDMFWYQRNLQILQRISTMNKDQLQKMILSQLQKIGMKNKCDNF